MRVKRYKPKHLNNVPKRRRFPATTLIAWLLIAVSLTTGATFSRYTATASGSDSARVAKWDITLNAKPTEAKQFTGPKGENNTETLSGYTFTVTNNSEVTAAYSLAVTFSEALDDTITPSISK